MPRPQSRPELRINSQRATDPGGGEPAVSLITGAAPAVSAPSPPWNLRVTEGPYVITAGNREPQAGFVVGWAAAAGTTPDEYYIQWATDSAFTAPVTRAAAGNQYSAALDGMPLGARIYYRAASRRGGVQGAWTVATLYVDTPGDTTAPDAPTALSTSWSGVTGDLTISWTAPASANLRDYRVRIYASSGGALLREVFWPATSYVWTRGQHYADTGGTYDPSVYLVITSRSVFDIYSAADLTGAASLSAPTTPSGLTHSWASGADVAGADLLVTWTASDAVAGYTLTVDGVARSVAGGRYTYPYTLNQTEHSGTADPVLSLSLVAVDALGQTSSAAADTATNAAPPATTITAFGAFSTVGLTIGASAALDIRDYRVRVYKDTTLVDTIYYPATSATYAVEDGDGSYTFDVAPRDLFGQLGTASSQTTAATMTDLTTFVATLRGGLIYTNSIDYPDRDGLAVLKDGNTTSGGVTYAGDTVWRWTQADWQEEIVTQTVEVSLSSTASCVIGYSLDADTWMWFYGTTPSGGRWQPTSSTGTLATAQAGAQDLTAGVWRIDIPTPRRARYIRLYHRHPTTAFVLREFFPSTLLRATYMEAESIKAVNIAAGTITGDRIVSTAIDGFTITGSTIRTNATTTRIEMSGTDFQVINSGVTRVRIDTTGLKTYDSSGNVQIEATTATDGALVAGAGTTILDDTGINVNVATSADTNTTNAYRFLSSGTVVGTLAMTEHATSGRMLRLSNVTGDTSGQVLLTARSNSGYAATARLIADNAALADEDVPYVQISTAADNTTTSALVNARAFYVSDGEGDATMRLTINSDGVKVSTVVAFNGASINSAVAVVSQAPSSAGASFRGLNESGTTTFDVYANGNGWMAGTLTQASDRRVKAEIAPVVEALALMRRLRPTTYRRGGQYESGLIAQDVQAIPGLAHLVREGPDGMLSLNYIGLIAYLVGAIQEIAG